MLSGLALAPVIIHLMMRTKPRRIVFPAMRFLKLSERRTQRSWRLRHLLLLLLRMLIFLLIALAFARPVVRAPWLATDVQATGTGIFILDDTLSMGARENGRTRFEIAREACVARMSEYVNPSTIAFLTLTAPTGAASMDLDFIRSQAQTARLSSRHATAHAALWQAASVASKSPAPRDIYLYTDLARSGWGDVAELSRLALDDARLFVVNVRGRRAENRFFKEVRLSSQNLLAGSRLSVTYDVAAGPQGTPGVVTFHFDGRKQAESNAARGAFTQSTFREGFYQGYVELAGADALMEDNRYHFSVRVGRRINALVVGDAQAIETRFARAALSPSQGSSIRVTVVRPGELGATDPGAFDVVFLTDGEGLSDAGAAALSKWVLAGGAFAVCAAPAEALLAKARVLIPANIKGFAETDEGTHLVPRDLPHPLLEAFKESTFTDRWLSQAVFRRRIALDLASISPRAQVLVTFNDGAPALLETPYGAGKVLFFASDLTRASSDFCLHPSFVAFMQECARYLSGRRRSRMIGTTEDSLVIEVPPSFVNVKADLSFPGSVTTKKIDIPSRRVGSDVLDFTAPGNYELAASNAAGESLRAGVSVNAHPAESDLSPIDPAEIRAVCENARVVPISARIDRPDEHIRGGVEVFPWILILLAVVLTAESLLANRFYGDGAQERAS